MDAETWIGLAIGVGALLLTTFSLIRAGGKVEGKVESKLDGVIAAVNGFREKNSKEHGEIRKEQIDHGNRITAVETEVRNVCKKV